MKHIAVFAVLSVLLACCDSALHVLGPGEETVVLYTFDVPENTQVVELNFTLSGIPIVPTFRAPNFQQVPARKLK
jgi:hypothetical protein